MDSHIQLQGSDEYVHDEDFHFAKNQYELENLILLRNVFDENVVCVLLQKIVL